MVICLPQDVLRTWDLQPYWIVDILTEHLQEYVSDYDILFESDQNQVLGLVCVTTAGSTHLFPPYRNLPSSRLPGSLPSVASLADSFAALLLSKIPGLSGSTA